MKTLCSRRRTLRDAGCEQLDFTTGAGRPDGKLLGGSRSILLSRPAIKGGISMAASERSGYRSMSRTKGASDTTTPRAPVCGLLQHEMAVRRQTEAEVKHGT